MSQMEETAASRADPVARFEAAPWISPSSAATGAPAAAPSARAAGAPSGAGEGVGAGGASFAAGAAGAAASAASALGGGAAGCLAFAFFTVTTRNPASDTSACSSVVWSSRILPLYTSTCRSAAKASPCDASTACFSCITCARGRREPPGGPRAHALSQRPRTKSPPQETFLLPRRSGARKGRARGG